MSSFAYLLASSKESQTQFQSQFQAQFQSQSEAQSEAQSSITENKNSDIPEMNCPFTLSDKGLEYWNTKYAEQSSNPIIPRTDEEVGFLLRLSRTYPISNTECKKNSVLVNYDGTLFDPEAVSLRSDENIYPIFYRPIGTKTYIVPLEIKQGTDLFAYSLKSKEYSARITIAGENKFFVPTGTICTEISLSGEEIDLPFWIGNKEPIPVAFWIVPIGTKIYNTFDTGIEGTMCELKVRIKSNKILSLPAETNITFNGKSLFSSVESIDVKPQINVLKKNTF